MLKPTYSSQFGKDIKRIKKRGKSQDKLKKVLKKLIAEEQLSKSCKDHKLIGNYRGRRECHIEPDWLLIYKMSGTEITFERTGSHSDLFE
ncbi:MAG: type II toxin-antitoxin system YafQ family toxin [Deltaproteobacteria bacterium]|nr:type II toxin-antitoxin system YafQ family toxin [Deltaproteobacteria bacterium]